MIKTHFSQFGEIIDCVVPRDPRTRFAKGFAFVTYTKGKAVDDVMANRPHQVRIRFTMNHFFKTRFRLQDVYWSQKGQFLDQKVEIQPPLFQQINFILVQLEIYKKMNLGQFSLKSFITSRDPRTDFFSGPGPVLVPGPNRSVWDQRVLVRGSLITRFIT